ncbi:MAG: fumarate hydratase [Microbacteriaceae bacterium]|nr:fumarate hydratase [Microbacteriaceae bacterium]
MSLTSIAIVAGLAILTLWGVVAPRGQWRVLTTWNRRSAWDGGPSSISVGIHRTVAILATLALLLTGWNLVAAYVATVTASVRTTSVVHEMWGYPTPMIVDRIVENATTAPSGLVQQPVVRYRAVNSAKRTPAYLFELPDWNRIATRANDGYIGTQPPVGIDALDSASIVVQLRGDSRCIPRTAVVVENTTTIAIGVFYGRPAAAPGAKAVAINSCTASPKANDAVSVLLPLSLAAAVGKRHVTNLDGSPIPLATDAPTATPTPAP